jgi:hypothetical protein
MLLSTAVQLKKFKMETSILTAFILCCSSLISCRQPISRSASQNIQNRDEKKVTWTATIPEHIVVSVRGSGHGYDVMECRTADLVVAITGANYPVTDVNSLLTNLRQSLLAKAHPTSDLHLFFKTQSGKSIYYYRSSDSRGKDFVRRDGYLCSKIFAIPFVEISNSKGALADLILNRILGGIEIE